MELDDIENILVQPQQGAINHFFSELKIDFIQILQIGNKFCVNLDVFVMEGRVFFQFRNEAADKFLSSCIDVGAVKGCKAAVPEFIECFFYIAHIERTIQTVAL